MNESSDPQWSPVHLSASDLERIAIELGFPPASLDVALEELEQAGLFVQASAPEAEGARMLTRAGRQFLAMRGDISHDALFFLPDVIDDLNARAALLDAGTTLVDRFRGALIDGRALEHARTLVPPAFASAVGMRMAYDLFAAAVALPARLAAGDPAGCIAEEILGVRMIELAEEAIDAQLADDEIAPENAAIAKRALRGLFELFEDEEVLALFRMREPSDAALAGEDVDQRLEHWFRPFGGTPATGHLEA